MPECCIGTNQISAVHVLHHKRLDTRQLEIMWFTEKAIDDAIASSCNEGDGLFEIVSEAGDSRETLCAWLRHVREPPNGQQQVSQLYEASWYLVAGTGASFLERYR